MRRELAAAIVQLVEEGKIDLDAPVIRYSNMAFDTLGDVIAKVSGQSFEE